MSGSVRSRELPLTRGALLRIAAGAIERLGLPLEPYARRGNVGHRWLECGEESVVPLLSVYRLLEAAARDVDGIGAVAGDIPVERSGQLGSIIRSGLSVLDALDRFVRYAPAFGPIHTTRLIRDPQTGGIWFARSGSMPFEGGVAHAELMVLRYVVQIGRLAEGAGFEPLALRFCSGVEAARAIEAVGVFQGVPAATGQPWGGVLFSPETLGRPLPSPKDGSPQHVDQWFESGPAGTPMIALREFLLSCLRGGLDTSQAHVAEMLDLRPRSLQRRLRRDGASYRAVPDQARYLRARELILAGDAVPLSQVAYDVGYSDQANFARAFKRWSGSSPSTLRSVRGPDAP